MPEGDTIHRAAQRLQILVGEQLEVETPHPRARVTGVAEPPRRAPAPRRRGGRQEPAPALRGRSRAPQPPAHEGPLAGRRAKRDEHAARDAVARPARRESGGGALERAGARAATTRGSRSLGPDILADPPDLDEMVERMRGTDQSAAIGEAVLDQRLVSGIGNMWRAEALWRAQVSPWARLGDVSDDELRSLLTEAAQLMRRVARLGAPPAAVYRQAGRPCPAAGRRSPRAARATPTASPTGARRAREERPRAPRKWVRLRAPHLHSALRGFCLGAFAFFGREIERRRRDPVRLRGARLARTDRRSTSTGRSSAASSRREAGACSARGDTAIALEALGREPAAAIFARAHARRAGGARALPNRAAAARRPTSPRRAAASTGTTTPSIARTRQLEESLFGERARLRRRRSARRARGRQASSSSETACAFGMPPTASSARTGPTPRGSCRRELRPRDRPDVRARARAPLPAAGAEPPDAPGEIADAVTALRLATCGPIAAGPVLFERLDWRPFGVRPVLPIAATQPPGEPTRLDVFRGGVARSCSSGSPRPRTIASSATRSTAGSSRCSRTGRSAPSSSARRSRRCSATATASWAAALRAAVLLGETGRERASLPAALRRLCEGVADAEAARSRAPRARRDARARERQKLVAELDESLLGVRPTPSGRVAQAVAS